MEAKQNDKLLRIWVEAARPRTLTLAFSSVLLGGFLAFADDKSSLLVTVLTLITATFLQILSNLANDYGDSIHGADRSHRIGPVRAVQSGRISSRLMRRAIKIVALMTAICGLILVWVAFGYEHIVTAFFFLCVGLVAIWAAISYTAGRVHYGYSGFGDISVLIFFGWVGVMGSYYLHTLHFETQLILPATSCGLLAVAVLNINNIRDLESDRQAGKLSVPVRLNLEGARRYNWLLLITALLTSLLYISLNYHSLWQFLVLITLPLLIKIGLAVSRKPPEELDPFLKQMSLTTLLFVTTLGLGQIVG